LPGRSPHEALDNFLSPIQRAISCVSKDVVRHAGDYELNTPCAIQVGKQGTIKLKGGKLYLTVQLNYEIINDPDEQGGYKINTTAYSYSIRDRHENEILRYDWHPHIEQIPYPHVHMEDSTLKKHHLPTSRIALEQVLRLIITQFDVKPKRKDWSAVLTRGLRAFEDHCSWHAEPRRS
jgi:hypothetical protein